MVSRSYLVLEFLILCLLIPGLIIYNVWAPFMFLFLWSAAAYAALILRKTDPSRTWKDYWNAQAVTRKNMIPILLRFAIACCCMSLFLWWYDPARLFGLLTYRPEFLITLMILYPLLSALPQEIIFCTFFFRRYQPFFGSQYGIILASAVIFAYAHILYINPVAPTLSFFGGLIFAMTYAKTKSLALVTIEHGLYGNALFFIGLGYYFYSGGVMARIG